MSNDFFNKVEHLVAIGVKIVQTPEDWVACSLKNYSLYFGNGISFHFLRQKNPLYPLNYKINYSHLEVEKKYILFSYKLLRRNIEPSQKEWDSFIYTLKTTTSDEFQEFIIANLIEVSNVLDKENKYLINFKINLLEAVVSLKKFFLIKDFSLLHHYKKNFVNLDKSEQARFVKSLIKIPLETVIHYQQSFLFFLINKTEYAKIIRETFFEEANLDIGLIIRNKFFFLESKMVYPTESINNETQVKNFIYVYSKLNDESFIDNWSENEFDFLINSILKYPNLKTHELEKIFYGVKNFYIRNKEFIESKIREKIVCFLKTYFDQYTKPCMTKEELFLFNNIKNDYYYLYSNWHSRDINEQACLFSINPEESFKQNMKKNFGLASSSFQSEFRENFFNKKFYYINKPFFLLGIFSQVIEDKNYLKQVYSFYFRNSVQLSNFGYSLSRTDFLSSDILQKHLLSLKFLKQYYSDKKITQWLINYDNFFNAIDLITDIHYGYLNLVKKTELLPEDSVKRMIKMPKKVKNLDELHDIVYKRISIISNENRSISNIEDHSLVIDGFKTIDRKIKFVIPKDSWELNSFAHSMKNCIGGYLDKILTKQSIIINIYKEGIPYINVEVKNYIINEIKKNNNQQVSKEEYELVNYVLSHSNLIKTQQKSF